MSHVQWTDGTFAFGEGPLMSCKAGPLHDDEPMDLQRIYLEQPQQHLTLVLTVDQADELEHELERARWHRVFRQQELTAQHKARLSVVDDDLNPADALEPHSVLDHPDTGRD